MSTWSWKGKIRIQNEKRKKRNLGGLKEEKREGERSLSTDSVKEN